VVTRHAEAARQEANLPRGGGVWGGGP
jgi:hypothetical protein